MSRNLTLALRTALEPQLMGTRLAETIGAVVLASTAFSLDIDIERAEFVFIDGDLEVESTDEHLRAYGLDPTEFPARWFVRYRISNEVADRIGRAIAEALDGVAFSDDGHRLGAVDAGSHSG